MRWTFVILSIVATACTGQVSNAPTSPTAVSGSPVGSQPAAGGSQAQHGTGLPFEAAFTRESQAAFEPPTTLVIGGRNVGTATHLGRFTAASEDRVDTVSRTSVGTFNFTAANGDEVWTTTVGGETANPVPNVSTAERDATIVGGTGRFAAATGRLTIRTTETIDFETNTATGSGTVEGEINLNR